MRQMFSKGQLEKLINEKITTISDNDVKYLMEHPGEYKIFWESYDGGIMASAYNKAENNFYLFKIDFRSITNGIGHWDNEEQAFFFDEIDSEYRINNYIAVYLTEFNFNKDTSTTFNYADMTNTQKEQYGNFSSNAFVWERLELKINNSYLTLYMPQVSDGAWKWINFYYDGKLYVLTNDTINKRIIMTPYTLS